MREQQSDTTMPTVELIGHDGNAFAVLGRCRRAARAAGWSDEQWARFEGEACSGDYDHLLATVILNFEVE
jgi:hypothetical protein